MKNANGKLKHQLEDYIPLYEHGNAASVSLKNFRADGIDITLDESLTLGGLLYSGLLGYIEIFENNKRIKKPAHPIIEAVYELLTGAHYLGNTPKQFEAQKLLIKLGMPATTQYVRNAFQSEI